MALDEWHWISCSSNMVNEEGSSFWPQKGSEQSQHSGAAGFFPGKFIPLDSWKLRCLLTEPPPKNPQHVSLPQMGMHEVFEVSQLCTAIVVGSIRWTFVEDRPILFGLCSCQMYRFQSPSVLA